jgi:hypothetical protein
MRAWAPRQIPALFTSSIPVFGRFGIPEHYGQVRESEIPIGMCFSKDGMRNEIDRVAISGNCTVHDEQMRIDRVAK